MFGFWWCFVLVWFFPLLVQASVRMVATGRIFPLQLPPGACRQLQQAGCYVVAFAQPSISAADAWMLPWGT